MLPFLLLVGIATNVFGVVVLALWPASVETRTGRRGADPRGARARDPDARLEGTGVLAVPGDLRWAVVVGVFTGRHPSGAVAVYPSSRSCPMNLGHSNPFADPPDDDAVHHFEHEWNGFVQGVLFLFGLVNAGVILRGYDTGTWAILLATMLGRPLGILAAVALALAAGFHLPRRVGWRELVVIAIATSSGFTFALFFATGFIPPGPVLAQIKLGALGTVIGAPLAIGAAWLLRVGRFAGNH